MKRFGPCILVHICIVILLSASANLVDAQERPGERAGDRFDSSLQFVPADASFYWSHQNNKRKWQAILSSRAFLEFTETRAAKAIWKSFQDGFQLGFESEIEDEQSLQDIKDWLKSDDGKLAISVALDAVSEEVFVFGDEHWADVLARTMSFYGKALQYGMANPSVENDHEVNRIVWEIASQEFLDAEIPAVLFGGRLTNKAQAKKLLKQLHAFLKSGLEDGPSEVEFLKSGLKLTETEQTLRLSLTLDSENIPWESIAQDSDLTPEEIQTIKQWWKGKSIVLALAVEGNFLTFGSAPTEKFFDELGHGELLANSSEFQPVQAFADRPVSSISYLSREFVHRANNADYIGEYYSNLFKGIRRESNDLDGNTELADAIENDLNEFAGDLKEFMPEAGAYLEFSFLTESGIEGYSYNWSESISFDGSKPLSILDHVDGNPALLVAARSKEGIKEFEFIFKYVNRIKDRTFDFVLDSAEGIDAIDRLTTTEQQVQAILIQLQTASERKLVPALEDGQIALVVDFKTESDHWFSGMPAADVPLPIPAAAIVMSVSDAELLKSALKDYFVSAQSIMDMLKELPQLELPEDFELPAPSIEPIGEATMYSYAIPDQVGIDSQLLLNLTINRKLLVLSLASEHSEKLLNATPLSVGGPLADTDRPLMFAVHYDNYATIEALDKWYNYLIQTTFGFQQPEDFSRHRRPLGGLIGIVQDDGVDQEEAIDDLEPADFIEFGQKTIDLLKCFRSYTAATYIEEHAQVTHFLYRFQDIDE